MPERTNPAEPDVTSALGMEELLASSVRQADKPMIVTTAELNHPGPTIVAVSEGMCQMTGYSVAELNGRTPRILQGPLTDRTVLSRLRENCSRGESFIGETVNYRKDGSPYIVAWCIDPVRNVTGAITHFVSVQRDVTAERSFAQRWLDTEQRAQRALAEVTRQMAAITEAILVLEKTKRSFRSAELAQLRRKLLELSATSDTSGTKG